VEVEDIRENHRNDFLIPTGGSEIFKTLGVQENDKSKYLFCDFDRNKDVEFKDCWFPFNIPAWESIKSIEMVVPIPHRLQPSEKKWVGSISVIIRTVSDPSTIYESRRDDDLHRDIPSNKFIGDGQSMFNLGFRVHRPSESDVVLLEIHENAPLSVRFLESSSSDSRVCPDLPHFGTLPVSTSSRRGWEFIHANGTQEFRFLGTTADGKLLLEDKGRILWMEQDDSILKCSQEFDSYTGVQIAFPLENGGEAFAKTTKEIEAKIISTITRGLFKQTIRGLPLIDLLHYIHFSCDVPVFIVGGSVLDTILGIPPKDFDVHVGCTWEELDGLLKSYYLERGVVANIKNSGKRKEFGMMKVIHSLEDGKDVEDLDIGPLKAGFMDDLKSKIWLDKNLQTIYSPSVNNQPANNQNLPKEKYFYGFSLNLEGDARCRDFNVNAIYFDVFSQKVYDPLGGLRSFVTKDASGGVQVDLAIKTEKLSHLQMDYGGRFRSLKLPMKFLRSNGFHPIFEIDSAVLIYKTMAVEAIHLLRTSPVPYASPGDIPDPDAFAVPGYDAASIEKYLVDSPKANQANPPQQNQPQPNQPQPNPPQQIQRPRSYQVIWLERLIQKLIPDQAKERIELIEDIVRKYGGGALKAWWNSVIRLSTITKFNSLTANDELSVKVHLALKELRSRNFIN